MRRKSRVLLSFFVSLFIFFIIANLPIITYGYDGCTGKTQYESYMDYQFPCFFGCGFGGVFNVKTITLSEVTLKGGTVATPSSPATATLTFSLNNPCPAESTFITSLNLTGSQISSIYNWDNNTRASSISNHVIFDSAHPGNNVIAPNLDNFSYYPESNTQQQITAGLTFNYVISFHNGQSVSGSVTAQ